MQLRGAPILVESDEAPLKRTQGAATVLVPVTILVESDEAPLKRRLFLGDFKLRVAILVESDEAPLKHCLASVEVVFDEQPSSSSQTRPH